MKDIELWPPEFVHDPVTTRNHNNIRQRFRPGQIVWLHPERELVYSSLGKYSIHFAIYVNFLYWFEST